MILKRLICTFYHFKFVVVSCCAIWVLDVNEPTSLMLCIVATDFFLVGFLFCFGFPWKSIETGMK